MSRIWTMHIPVLSTAHLPSNTALEEISIEASRYEGGWFVRLPNGSSGTHDVPQWVHDVRNWMNSNGFADETWVRFDSIGDRVDIPTYAW